MYDTVGAHDFEMKLSIGLLSEGTRHKSPVSVRDFRSALAYWHSRGMLQDSHLSLPGASRASVMRVSFR